MNKHRRPFGIEHPTWENADSVRLINPADREEPQPRPLASYETGFWAFLEYPSVWIAVLIFTAYMAGALIVLMVRG